MNFLLINVQLDVKNEYSQEFIEYLKVYIFDNYAKLNCENFIKKTVILISHK